MRSVDLCVASVAVGIALCASAGDALAQFPAVREVRAHRANYSARSTRTIRKIVIHTSEGSEASCVSWFRNPRARVSAHYLVAKQGRITRFVPDMSVAYHARRSNADTIGIENEGRAAQNGWTSAQYRSLAALVRGLCDRHRIPKDRRFIIGHDQVPGSYKEDPGRFFDWNRLMSLVHGGPVVGTGVPSTGPTMGTTTGLTTVVTSSTVSATRSLVEVTVDGLRVRAAPGGEVLGQIGRGTRFVASEVRAGWTRIAWRGRSAWISEVGFRRVGGEVEIVTASSLNVRAGPGTAATVLGQAARDQAYHPVERRGSWVLIQFDQRRGWVHTDHTRTSPP